MEASKQRETVKTLTTHYIDGAFVESHGREVMDIVRPTDGHVIARATLADEEDTRRAIAALTRAPRPEAPRSKPPASTCSKKFWK